MGNSTIFGAAAIGDILAVTQMLNPRRLELRRDESGSTALHMAARYGQAGAASLLCEHGACPNARDERRETPLHAAARSRSVEVVRVLLDAKALPLLLSESDETALDIAVNSKAVEVVNLLLSECYRSGPGHRALSAAIRQGDHDILSCFNTCLKQMRVKDLEWYLYAAAASGDESTVCYLLDRGLSIETIDTDGVTLLHLAASQGSRRLIRHLLDEGAPLDARDQRVGGTPLFAALQSKDEESAKMLLEAGADVNVTVRVGNLHRHLLHCFAQEEFPDSIGILLSHGVDPNVLDEKGARAVTRAAEAGHVKTLEVLHRAGCDVLQPDYFGRTPLLEACLGGHLGAVRYLLSCKADPNAREDSANTPLDAAIQANALEVVKTLCENGAEVSNLHIYVALNRRHFSLIAVMLPHVELAADKDRLDWELIACHASQAEVATMIESGLPVQEMAKPELQRTLFAAIIGKHYHLVHQLLNKHGDRRIVEAVSLMTPLHVAAEVGNLEIFSLLVEEGFSITSQTQYGQTVLHLAARHDRSNLIQELQGMLSTDIVDTNGQTPLHWAAAKGHRDSVALLISHGAYVDRKDSQGRTPLYLACFEGHDVVAQRLVEAGALPDIVTKSLWTPLHNAAGASLEIVAMLLKTGRVEVNALTAGKIAPIHLAFSRQVAEILLEHGGDPHLASSHGLTPLGHAAQSGRHDIVRLLLPLCKDWISVPRNRDRLWILACTSSDHAVFQAMLESGLALEDLGPESLIPMLTEAALCRNDRTLAAILEHMLATSMLEDLKLAFRILVMAVEGNCIESTRTLSSLRGIHNIGSESWKPLHLACQSGDRRLVEALLESDADPRVANPVSGLSVMEVAEEAEKSDIVKILKVWLR